MMDMYGIIIREDYSIHPSGINYVTESGVVDGVTGLTSEALGDHHPVLWNGRGLGEILSMTTNGQQTGASGVNGN